MTSPSTEASPGVVLMTSPGPSEGCAPASDNNRSPQSKSATQHCVCSEPLPPSTMLQSRSSISQHTSLETISAVAKGTIKSMQVNTEVLIISRWEKEFNQKKYRNGSWNF